MRARFSPVLALSLLLHVASADAGLRYFPYDRVEGEYHHAGDAANPYVEIEATAQITRPDGRTWAMPLFWDGGRTWRLRFSPDAVGTWTWTVASADAGLNGSTGRVLVEPADAHGALTVMPGHPHHFARQDGTPDWFMGDTAWALFTDIPEEQHDWPAAEEYLKVRWARGFNVIHAMLLSEAGDGNAGGPPFADLARGEINPGYWQEVDRRLEFATATLSMTAGLALAWGNKRDSAPGSEPYSWGKFPNDEARRRYVRYVVARCSAYRVYFLVSGEWDAEYHGPGKPTPAATRERFDRLGELIRELDPHDRHSPDERPGQRPRVLQNRLDELRRLPAELPRPACAGLGVAQKSRPGCQQRVRLPPPRPKRRRYARQGQQHQHRRHAARHLGHPHGGRVRRHRLWKHILRRPAQSGAV